jgi:hypothetical protein
MKSNESLALVKRTRSETQEASEQSLVSTNRRDFLICSALGATGLALTPLQKSLALSDFALYGYSPVPKRGFWATFLGYLDLAASLFGLGGIIPAITGLVRCVVNNRQQVATDAFNNALGAMRSSGFPLNIINRPSNALSEIGIRLVSGLLQSLPCAAQQGASVRMLNASTLAHHYLLPPPADLRFTTPALKDDNLNGISLYFDYSNARNPRDFEEKAAISAPTTLALGLVQEEGKFARYGITNEIFKDAIMVPKDQPKNNRALGGFDADYRTSDRYTTRDDATFEIDYSNLTKTDEGGTGRGEITFHGLVDRSASNKRMGLKRIEYSFNYPPADGRRRVLITYTKGFTEFRP